MSWETVYNCGSLDSDEDSFRRFILLNLVNVSAISSASSFFSVGHMPAAFDGHSLVS